MPAQEGHIGISQAAKFFLVDHLARILKPVMLALIEQVNALLQFVFGEMAVESLVVSLNPQ